MLEENRKYVIASQLLKSGTSIGANIREAQNSSLEMQVVIYNVNGEIVLKKSYFKKVNEIDISNELPGIYLMNIQVDDKNTTAKLVLKN